MEWGASFLGRIEAFGDNCVFTDEVELKGCDGGMIVGLELNDIDDGLRLRALSLGSKIGVCWMIGFAWCEAAMYPLWKRTLSALGVVSWKIGMRDVWRGFCLRNSGIICVGLDEDNSSLSVITLMILGNLGLWRE